MNYGVFEYSTPFSDFVTIAGDHSWRRVARSQIFSPS
jgi:hypothetical protein